MDHHARYRYPHAGAYSLYMTAFRRTDRLSADIWKVIQSEPEYAGKTTLFILPDFAVTLTTIPAATDSSIIARRCALPHTWMMALGAGVKRGGGFRPPHGVNGSRPNSGSMLGFSPSLAQGKRYRNFCRVLCFHPISTKQFNRYPPEARKLVTATC